MSECGGTLLPIRRQDSPDMTLTHSQDLCRLTYGYLIFQNPVEHLKPVLFFPSQCQFSHKLTFSLTR